MKILLIGADGQLGTDLVKVLPSKNLIPFTIKDIDITDYSASQTVIAQNKPYLVINTAAYHNVPLCEEHIQESFQVNTIGPHNLVKICGAQGIKLTHFSTDYVFDGRKNTPYTEDDLPNPLNVYGVSKLAGEYFVRQLERYYIIRTAGLYGMAGCLGKGGTNFIENMLRLAKTQPAIRVANNIITSPTCTYDLALKIKEIIDKDYPSGIYHIVNSGQCSWYEFALEIFRLTGIKAKVEPKEEKALEAGVKRPLYSALTSKKLTPLRPWSEALKDYLTTRSLKTPVTDNR
jgi:dTDP-4-dehydrorhamnose reductase